MATPFATEFASKFLPVSHRPPTFLPLSHSRKSNLPLYTTNTLNPYTMTGKLFDFPVVVVHNPPIPTGYISIPVKF